MIQNVKTALRRVEITKYVSDPREDYRQWRESDRPVYALVHGILEVVLVAGLGLRFFTHMMGYAMYHNSKHGEAPDLSDDMFGFTNLVKPLLEPEHWHQEALMRGLTFLMGVLFLLWAAATPAYRTYMANEAISPLMVYWGRMFIATHLCLDPVLGVAWRLANADLRAWV